MHSHLLLRGKEVEAWVFLCGRHTHSIRLPRAPNTADSPIVQSPFRGGDSQDQGVWLHFNYCVSISFEKDSQDSRITLGNQALRRPRVSLFKR